MMSEGKHREWRLAQAVTAAVVILSVVPVRQTPPVPEIPWDKAAHFLMYLFLSVAVSRAFFSGGAARPEVRAVGYVCVLGFLIEVIQYFLPYRSFEWYDLVCDCLGGLAGAGGYYLFRRSRIPSPDDGSAVK